MFIFISLYYFVFMRQERCVTKVGTGRDIDEAISNAVRLLDHHCHEGNYSDSNIDSYLICRNGGVYYLYLGATLHNGSPRTTEL